MTSKGQTTLPRDVRVAFGLKSGDKVYYVVTDGEVRLFKAWPVADLEGLLAVTLKAMDDAIAAPAAEDGRGAEGSRSTPMSLSDS